MVMILVSWFLLAFFFITTGIAVCRQFSIQTNLPITILLGMFGQSVLLSVAAFFINIGWEVFLANSILIVVLSIFLKTEWKNVIRTFIRDFSQLRIYSKVLFSLICITALIKCSQSPFIIDNESYYIQTIKWLNEYGYVKGLANLHVYLAQCSPWHILQSGFNFGFVTNNLNDINGFLLIACSFYYISESENLLAQTGKISWIGLMPIFNLLLFLFIDSPSPDLPLILITPIIFHLFLTSTVEKSQHFLMMLLLAFLVFIKITILPIVLVFVFLQISRRQKLIIGATGLTLAIILVGKNLILSGHPFYPFQYFAADYSWTLPEQMWEFMRNTTQNYAWYKDDIPSTPGTIFDKLRVWIQLGGVDGIFNKTMIILFILMPFTNIFKVVRNVRIMYFIFLVHFIILLLISPQYRFFLPQILIFIALIVVEAAEKLRMERALKIAVGIGAVLPIILISGFSFKSIANHSELHTESDFEISQLLIPADNSKFTDLNYEMRTMGNLNYYTPDTNFMFFGTADGPLPCVNEIQIEYLKRKYQIIPQMNGEEIEDGFYSVILEKQ